MKTTKSLLCAFMTAFLSSCAFGQGSFTNCLVNNQLTVGTTLLLPGTSSITQNSISTASKWVAVTTGGSILIADNNGAGSFSELVLAGNGTETLAAGTSLFLTGTTGIALTPGISQYVTVASGASGIDFLGAAAIIGSSTIGISTASTLSLSAGTLSLAGTSITMTGSPIPNAANSYDIGTSPNPWRNCWFNGQANFYNVAFTNQFFIGGSAQGYIAENGDKGIAIVCAGAGPNVVIGNTNFGNDVRLTSNPPANSSATGTTGTITWDSSFLYICVGTNSWRRVALSSF